MKTITLKENQTLYEVVAKASPDEPIVVEREGRPMFVLVPYDEYKVFRAWQAYRAAVPGAEWPDDRTLEEVVADIKRLGPGIPNIHEATASLAELLENAPHDPDFNLEEWQREWAKVEAEMKAADERDWAKTEAEMRAALERDQ